MRRWLNNRIVRGVLGLLLGGLAGFAAVLYVRIRQVDDLQPTREADCIIVLGAGVRDAGPGRCYRPRLNHAVTLYEQGISKHIIVTELSPAAEVARRHLLQRGIPPSAIALENESRDTWENLQFSREIMRERGWEGAVVVTCPFHIYRARAMARDLGIDAQMAAAPNSPTEQYLYRHVKYTLREVLAYAMYKAGLR